MKDILSILSIISIAMERTGKELWEQYKEDVSAVIYTLAIVAVWAAITYALKSVFALFLPNFVAWTIGTLLGIPIVYVLLMFIYNIFTVYDDYKAETLEQKEDTYREETLR